MIVIALQEASLVLSKCLIKEGIILLARRENRSMVFVTRFHSRVDRIGFGKKKSYLQVCVTVLI